MKKSLIALALTAGLFSSCLGTNAAFNNIQNWNSEMSENKWVVQGISVLFWVVPVYSLSLFADVIIFNSIEFWGGTNPISSDD